MTELWWEVGEIGETLRKYFSFIKYWVNFKTEGK